MTTVKSVALTIVRSEAFMWWTGLIIVMVCSFTYSRLLLTYGVDNKTSFIAGMIILFMALHRAQQYSKGPRT